jgi:hypothetical protein
MRALILALTAAAVAFGSDIKTDDSWSKIKQLKSGTEIRIYKRGAAQPVMAKAADATDDKLIVVVKNTQMAIDKKDIDRIDARPGPKKTSIQSTATNNEPAAQPVDGVRPENYPKPGSSYSTAITSVTPGFETIYQRRAGAK